ncbi:MAG: MarR family transcriptional regulator [Isosphaeraceae bacterium]|nr:MAG: MarR family transcriptional regulator [Isosphaeraceae bacterium]
MRVTVDRVACECVAVRLRALNRCITNIYDEALRPLDLKVSQMNILVAAARMGTARPAQVCEQLHLDASTLSRNVDRMKARGWLETVAGEDGRSQPFRLTAEGSRLLERAIPAWSKAQHQVKKIVGTTFLNQLEQALDRVGRSAAD